MRLLKLAVVLSVLAALVGTGAELASAHVDRGVVRIGPSVALTFRIPWTSFRPSARRTTASDVSGSITPGGPPVTVTISTAGDNAALTFTGTAGQRVFVGFSNNTIANNQCCNTVAWIKKPDGSNLTSMSRFIEGGSNYIDTATLATAGTYTIYIDPQGSATGSVTVTLYDVPADPAPMLTPTPAGASATMSTTVTGQNFSPRFTGSAGQRVFVGFSNNTIANNQCCNTVAWIKKPDGSNLTSMSRFIEGGSNYIDTATLPTGGTYTVFIDPSAFLVGTITVTIYDVPADPAPVLTPTQAGSPATMTTSVPGQNFGPTFAATAGQRVFVGFSNNTIANDQCCNTVAWIKKPDGSNLTSMSRFIEGGSNYIDTVTLPTAGLYTVFVDPQAFNVGTVTVTVFDVPPDPEPVLELSAEGSSYTFTTATKGQNAMPVFDGVATEPVSVRLTANTISGGGYCTLSARIVKPDGSTLTSQSCVSNADAKLGSVTLPTDGLYSIVVDPVGPGVGSVTVTLYLDEPEVTPGGALYDDVVFVNGTQSYSANVSAHFPNGVNRAWLERTGVGEIATSATCTAGPGACPQDVEAATSVDTVPLAEGAYEFVAKAVGSAGQASDVETWQIYVDRTAPAAPAGFRIETYDGVNGTATLAWDEGVDPDLTDGSDGAGAASYDYRYRIDAQTWSAWLSTENSSAVVTVAPGSTLAVEGREIDGAGNTSVVGSASLAVLGSEGATPASEVAEPAFSGSVGPIDADIPESDTQQLSFTQSNTCPLSFADDATSPTWRFTNCDGTWYIFKDCFDQNMSGGRFTVGPGYIAHMRTPGSNGRVLVRDDRIRTDAKEPVSTGNVRFGPLGAMNGGLGTFGFHYAQSTNDPGAVPAGTDATRALTSAESEVISGGTRDARAVPVVEGRQCAGKNGNPDYGVYAVTRPPKLISGQANNPKVDGQGFLRFAVSVWFRDEWGNTGNGPNAAGDPNTLGDAIARVTYSYIFQPSVVRAWMAVTTYGSSSGGRTRYIKEPKFTAVVRGGGFSRLKVFGGAKGGLALPSTNQSPSVVVDGPVQTPRAVVSPRQVGYRDRTRVQWDYGSNACGDNCFSVVMRAYPVVSRTTGGLHPGESAPLWQQTENLHAGFGLDWWARISGKKWQYRAQAYPRDTRGDQIVWACIYAPQAVTDAEKAVRSEQVTTNVTGRRRWEIGGWKPTATAAPFVASSAAFSGWNGGRGPYDCEQMEVKFSDSVESFGTFASYSVGPGWTLK